MRKALLMVVAATVILAMGVEPTDARVNRDPGGVPAFLVGCCWGIREGTMWNEGSDLHWREWTRLIPYVNIVIAIWDGVDSYKGMTSHQWAEQNGANWY